MEDMIDSTIRYYDNNSESYFNNTVSLDMNELYSRFLIEIKPGGRIIDVGCGSGRDSKYFINAGYEVVSIDASSEMCNVASDYLQSPVSNMNVLDLKYKNKFDGVWACASLLHLPRINQYTALDILVKSLKNNGILYASWKYGVNECSDGKRFFCNHTEDSLIEIINYLENIEVIDIWKTDDKKQGNDIWINLLLKKITSMN